VTLLRAERLEQVHPDLAKVVRLAAEQLPAKVYP
jgi:hypothetical protein